MIVLARGAGEPITEDAMLLTNTAFASWDGSASGSSWGQQQPQIIPMFSAPNLAGLVGVPVGSRVMVLAPAGTDQKGQSVPPSAHVMDIDAAL